MLIDYSQPPPLPPLSEAESAWLTIAYGHGAPIEELQRLMKVRVCLPPVRRRVSLISILLRVPVSYDLVVRRDGPDIKGVGIVVAPARRGQTWIMHFKVHNPSLTPMACRTE